MDAAVGNDMSKGEEELGKEEAIYSRRFTETEEKVRRAVWRVLVPDFFQQFIPSDAAVLDLGAGDGNFIRNVQARRRLAVDLSPHVLALRDEGVEVFQTTGSEFSRAIGGEVDVIFASNFFEHLPSKQVLFKVLEECRAALRPGGRLLILQPNIRYAKGKYWDYIDHHLPLTENSLAEALETSGFIIEKIIPKFLPYTAKSALGHAGRGGLTSFLVKLYLRLPILWPLFGEQSFLAART